jgi:inner membrane protein
MDTAQPPVIPTPGARRLAVFLKIGFICLLIAFLHIPLGMTHGVLRERRAYQQQATDEIAAIWGHSQLVTGPVLAVPYTFRQSVVRPKVVNGKKEDVEEMVSTYATAYFLPEVLKVRGQIDPEVRRRGIYDTVVYSTKLKLEGSFQPDFGAAGIGVERIIWENARVLFGVSDLRGIRGVSPVSINGAPGAPFEAADIQGEPLPLAAKIPGAAAGTKLEFSFEAALQGSERLDLVPVGKMTQVALTSSWGDPSFGGAYLPAKRDVGPAGFSAEWETSHFSRGFGQSWQSRGADAGEMPKRFAAAAFGVRFAQPVDGYSMAERAQKYGVLFFVLVFAVFFLFEVTAPALRIHPLQYAMVGAALALFFLGFLALSEFWSTAAAYGAAAGACTLLVSLYAWSFLQTGWRTLVVTGGLGATYGYLYFVLQSQDYALVAGTAALFGALALVMFCTRRINWYSLEMNTPAATAAGNR